MITFFKKEDTFDKKPKKEGDFFEQTEKKRAINPKKKEEQKRVDSALLSAVSKVPLMRHYLNAKFSLNKGQYPHQIKF